MTELTRRYVVMAMAADAPFDPNDPDGVFVLKPWKDPAALQALAAYREHCYPELSRDLEAWIRVIEAGPVVRGDVGRRNEAFAKPHDGARRTSPTGAAARIRRPAGRRAATRRQPPRATGKRTSPRGKKRRR